MWKANHSGVVYMNDSILLFPEITTDNRSLEELIESVVEKGVLIHRLASVIFDSEKEAFVPVEPKIIKLAVVRGHPFSDCISPITASEFGYNAKLVEPTLRDTLYLCEQLSAIDLERFVVRLLFVMHEPVLCPEEKEGKDLLFTIGFVDGEVSMATYYYNEGYTFNQNTGYAFLLP